MTTTVGERYEAALDIETGDLDQELARVDAALDAIAIDGDKAAGGMRRAGEGMKKLAAEAKATEVQVQNLDKGLGGISKASKNRGRELGGLVNVAAELGFSVGAAVPALRQMGTQLAIMGGSAYQLGAAFGVVGVGVAVLTGVVPILISAVTDLISASDAADASTNTLTSSLHRQAEQARETVSAIDAEVRAVRELARTNARAAAIAQGRGTEEEQVANLSLRTQALRESQREVERLEASLRDFDFGVIDAITGESPEQKLLQQQLLLARDNLARDIGRVDRARESLGVAVARSVDEAADERQRISDQLDIEAAQADQTRESRRRGGGGGAQRRQQADVDPFEDRQIIATDRLHDAIVAIADENDRRIAQERELAELAERQLATREAEDMARGQAALKLKAIEAARIEQAEITAEQLAQERDTRIDINRITTEAEQQLSLIARAAEESARLVISGNLTAAQGLVSFVDQWAEGFALQETGKAISAFAEGIGNAVMNQPHAAAKLAEGGAHLAAAALVGGVAIAIPSQSGSAGATPSAPTTQGSSGGGGGGNTTVIFNAPIPTTEVGRQTDRALRASHRRDSRRQ